MEASLTNIPRLVDGCTIITSFSLAHPVHFSLFNDLALTQRVAARLEIRINLTAVPGGGVSIFYLGSLMTGTP